MGEPTPRRRFGVLISNLRKEEANGQDRGIRTSQQPRWNMIEFTATLQMLLRNEEFAVGQKPSKSTDEMRRAGKDFVCRVFCC